MPEPKTPDQFRHMLESELYGMELSRAYARIFEEFWNLYSAMWELYMRDKAR